MTVFNWLDRQYRLSKRKQRLGEKYTSDLTTRKFMTEDLKNLNSEFDFSEVLSVYQIGWCNGQDNYIKKIKELINQKRLDKISELGGIEYAEDEMGEIPVGNYVQIFLFQMKAGRTFLQLIAGSFDSKGQEIKFEEDIDLVDIDSITKRKLIFPI